MKLKTVLLVTAFAGASAAVLAAPPENVGARRHPNIAAAQRLVDQAYEKIAAAQRANEYDMDGHAAKAKELLDQANRELKQAAMAANRK